MGIAGAGAELCKLNCTLLSFLFVTHQQEEEISGVQKWSEQTYSPVYFKFWAKAHQCMAVYSDSI